MANPAVALHASKQERPSNNSFKPKPLRGPVAYPSIGADP